MISIHPKNNNQTSQTLVAMAQLDPNISSVLPISLPSFEAIKESIKQTQPSKSRNLSNRNTVHLPNSGLSNFYIRLRGNTFLRCCPQFHSSIHLSISTFLFPPFRKSGPVTIHWCKAHLLKELHLRAEFSITWSGCFGATHQNSQRIVTWWQKK